MGTLAAIDIHQHNHRAAEKAESNQAPLAVILADVFARDREVVPYGIGLGEIELVALDVAQALSFVPSGHNYIVVTKY